MDNNQPLQPNQNPGQAQPLNQPQQPPQPNIGTSNTPAPQQTLPPNQGAPVQSMPNQSLPTQNLNQPRPQIQPQFPQGQPLQYPNQPQFNQGTPYQNNQYNQQYQPRPAGNQNQYSGNQNQMPNQNYAQGQRPLQQQLRPQTGTSTGPNPKSIILGCLGFFGVALLLFVVFVIFYVSQTSASGDNGLAKALGVNPGELTNSLVMMTNLIFGLIASISFFVGVIGVFRAAMAPKLDKAAKSSGYRQAGVAGVIFVIITTLWVFVSIYLGGKKVDLPTQTKATQGVVTDPENTTKLTAPVDVKFDATKIPVNADLYEITFYQWDFGDGGKSTLPTVTHTFRDIGQFTTKLTVTAREKSTNKTATDNYEKLITISSVQISASFAATPENGPAPLSVAFDASDSSSPAGKITTYEWDFKGQNTFRDATGVKTQFTFDKVGDYDVKLRVTDDSGQSNVVTKKITAGGPDVPVPVIDIPTESGKYYVNKPLVFNGDKSTSPNGEINKYEWNFGDGSPKANTRTANHTYTKTGVYEVILRTTDETGKVGETSQKLTVTTEESAPQAVIDTVPGPANSKDQFISGQVPFEVRFSGDQSTDPDKNIVDYKWDFNGDGQDDASGVSANYIYKEAGSYNATLTVIDAKGNTSTATFVVKVAAQDLQARVTADKVEGNNPLNVTFDASSSSYPDGQITSYEWDFGDGSPKRIDASQVTYQYTSIGTFTASVLAKASDGKTSKATIIINIRPIALKACFKASTEQGAAPIDIEFDPRCSQGSVAKYLWDFGDGTTSRTRKPTHTFDKPGSYQVTLEVTDNSNVVNTYSKNILVTGTL